MGTLKLPTPKTTLTTSPPSTPTKIPAESTVASAAAVLAVPNITTAVEDGDVKAKGAEPGESAVETEAAENGGEGWGAEDDNDDDNALDLDEEAEENTHVDHPQPAGAEESSTHPHFQEAEVAAVVSSSSSSSSTSSQSPLPAPPNPQQQQQHASVPLDTAAPDENAVEMSVELMGAAPTAIEDVMIAEHSDVMERSTHAETPLPAQQQSSPSAPDSTTMLTEPVSPEKRPPVSAGAPTTPAPSSSLLPGRTKLLLLMSSSSINRQVKVRQDLVENALQAAGIHFDSLDGALPEHKALRDELFALSGLRGEYPQFFLVPLDSSGDGGGGTRYWGEWTRFQHANDDQRLVEEFGTTLPPPETPIVMSSSSKTASVVPEEVLENFSNQIKRIEMNYQTERAELEQRHARELREAGNHEACQAAQSELESRFMAQIELKDSQLVELARRNEGYRLKLDMLKREVTGTQELLQERDGDVGKANEKYLRDLRAMEKQLNEALKRAEQSQQETRNVQESLHRAREELVASQREHSELKERTKTVASELKDRRAECRELWTRMDELMGENKSLQSTVESLRERLNHQGINQTEKDGELEDLRKQLANSALEKEKALQEWKDREAKSRHDLVEYKKKAQNSLALANSRTAAAVQAREEAELDARAARSTADSAFERVSKAELASREAIAVAKTSVQTMEKERDKAVSALQNAELALQSNREQVESLQRRLADAVTARDSALATLHELRLDLEREQGKAAASEQKLRDAAKLTNNMHNEIAVLKEQLQRVKAEVAEQIEEKDENAPALAPMPPFADRVADDVAVAHLQQELNEANETIEELKESLKNAVVMGQHNGHASKLSASENLDESQQSVAAGDVAGTETIPLFYAMEKQAELKTARNEINRLASVLSEAETQKTEAHEAMEAMRRRMEDAEARLRRFESLGAVDIGAATSSSAKNGEAKSNGAVKIEFLKNVMLSFLNAKTVEEKSKLVHVIGMVLELTPEELNSALQSLHQKGSIAGSLFGWS